MKKIACFILSYEITKGMKSVGPKALLKSKKAKELINYQIDTIKDKNIDIYVILGFGSDKIKKRIEHQKVSIVPNDLYESTNDGYALELILQKYDCSKYGGCVIINSGILFHKCIKTDIIDTLKNNKSKIYYFNHNNHNNTFPIGFTIIDSFVQHMFFNLSNNIWNEIIYISNETMVKYQEIYNKSMRNMFLFEFINKSIDLGINYSPIKVKYNSVIKITSIKDTNKIKELT